MNKRRRSDRQAAYRRSRRREKIRPRVTMGSGFPKMLKTKLHYVDANNIFTSVAAGTVTTWNYNLNGMYDFDYTGTGHQPFYFDQYSALYNHYVVIGTKVTIAFTNPSNVPIIVGGYINDDVAIAAPNINTFMEEPTSQWKVIPPNQEKPVYITWKWSAKKYFTGRASTILADTDLQGTSSGNPAELSVLSLFARAQDATSTTSFAYTVRAEFVCIWKELRDITGS